MGITRQKKTSKDTMNNKGNWQNNKYKANNINFEKLTIFIISP